MKELLEEHCRWMETRNYAQGTLQNNRLYVGRFIDWLAERGVLRAPYTESLKQMELVAS